MPELSLQHLRVLEPAPGVLAFYDGRPDEFGVSSPDNWVEDGALSLGIASYAIIDGGEALVYDTHVSKQHAGFIREHLASRGVRNCTVLLSHWHLDHVAGTEVFSDCDIIANTKTAAHLAANRAAIEAGTLSGPPAISPLILPTRTFEGSLRLTIGKRKLEVMESNIHSDDASLIWMPDRGLLLAGDALEDTITYVDEPRDFPMHLANLDRLWALSPARILPNHGDPEIIASGGYERTLIRATQQYIRMLQHALKDEALRLLPLADFIRGPLELGWVNLYAPYERVHRQNLECTLKALLT
jgi:glyoxylase-like metal-dependent hydrolase (beta-lactamase superfamily II)